MDAKREAVEKLTQYEAKRRAVENIPAEIDRLGIEFLSIRSARTDATPVQGGGSTREEAMIANIDRREELARRLEAARAWVDLVEAGLRCLDEEERLVLDRFYIHREPGHINYLMRRLHLCRSVVYDRAERALSHFAAVLYGGERT